jgi:hypothetical protein
VATGSISADTGIKQESIYLPPGVTALVGVDVFNTDDIPVQLVVYNVGSGAVLARSHLAFKTPLYPAPFSHIEPLMAEVPAQSTQVQLGVDILVPQEVTNGVETATFYVDSAFCYFGSTPVKSFFDGDSSRAQWGTDGLAVKTGLERSQRRGHYITYITGMNESFRSDIDGEGKVTRQSEIVLFLREAEH